MMRLNNLSALGLLISLEFFVEVTSDTFREAMRHTTVPMWLQQRNINDIITTTTLSVIIISYLITIGLWLNAGNISRRFYLMYCRMKRKYILLSNRKATPPLE